MKTLAASLVASLALLSRPTAGEDRGAVRRSRAVGSRAPPLSSAWTSKAASAASGSSSRARPLTPSTAGGAAGQDRRHRRHRRRTKPASGGGGRGGELARLRGGWLGVDLVQEIAKSYISRPAGAGAASGGREGGQGGGDRGAAAGTAAAATATATAATTTNATTGRGGGGGGGGVDGRSLASSAPGGGDRKNGGGGGSSSGSGSGGGGVDEGRESQGSSVAAAGVGRSDGSRSGGGGVQGKMSRLRSALQQVGDVSSSTNAATAAATTTSPSAATLDGQGSSTGGSGNANANTNTNRTPDSEGSPNSLGWGGGVPPSDAPESSRNNASPASAAAGGGSAAAAAGNDSSGSEHNSHNGYSNGGGGGGGGGGQHSGGGGGGTGTEPERGETAAAAASNMPSPGEEDEARWEGRWEDRAGFEAFFGRGSGSRRPDFGGEGQQGGVSAPGEGEGQWDDEREEAEAEAALERARAAAAVDAAREEPASTAKGSSAPASSLDAARAQNEIALLREMEAVQDRAVGGRPQETIPLGHWGQYTRSVVTNAMPARFIDEVGAHVASALALAAFKGLIYAVVNMRGQKKHEKVAFKDVVGCDEAKEEVKQIVDFLVDPSAYDSLGATRPKGILLVGPPGTGKTLIAKACAGEAGVPFLYACGSDFNGVYVGMGVAAVKRIFAKARKHKKSIIYIDEIDYLGRARGGGSREASGATQDREATLNQLLSEMDGFEGKDGIVVMASTNRKEILDDALLRSGRFDMQVDVERPDRKGREQLFSKYISPLKLSDEEHPNEAAGGGGGRDHRRGGIGARYFGGASSAMAAEKEKEAAIKKQGLREDIARELADMTPYMTGADVANVCATAGRIAARAGSDSVVLEHFSAAVDRVLHGLEKPDKQISREEKERTAIHEAGHAVAAWMLPWCDEVVKVSIVWRGNALGFSQTAMVERQSQMREMVLDSVCMTLAGRAAEEVICGTISGGASSDLRVASRQLYSAITEVGFGSTSLLAPGNRQLSEKVMAEVDEEVQSLLAQQYQRALALIRANRDKIDSLSKALLERNVVHKADLRKILGEKVTVESEEAAAEAALNSALLNGNNSADSTSAPASDPSAEAASAPTAEEDAHSVRNTDAPATV